MIALMTRLRSDDEGLQEVVRTAFAYAFLEVPSIKVPLSNAAIAEEDKTSKPDCFWDILWNKEPGFSFDSRCDHPWKFRRVPYS